MNGHIKSITLIPVASISVAARISCSAGGFARMLRKELRNKGRAAVQRLAENVEQTAEGRSGETGTCSEAPGQIPACLGEARRCDAG